MNDLIDRQDAIEAIRERHARKKDSIHDIKRIGYTVGMLEAIDAIEEVPTASQWIPCDERMPKGEQMVIACTEEGFIVISLYTDENLFEDVRETVVAWMPLPTPYESPEDV